MAHPPAIHLQNVTKRYDAAIAVNQLNLEVPAGAIFGFLGPNGAGKSTTIKIMSGILHPDEGEARILGISVHENSVAVKRIIGVVPETLALFEYLTIFEHMDLVRSLFEISTQDFEERSAQLLRMLNLNGDAGKLIRQASYGMKKKTALAMSLLPNPRVLILDEPFEGLDPVIVVNVKQALRSAVSRDMTVFLTTHLLATVDDLITHYGIVRQGCLVALGTARELAAKGTTLEEEYLKHFEDARPGELLWLG